MLALCPQATEGSPPDVWQQIYNAFNEAVQQQAVLLSLQALYGPQGQVLGDF